MQRKWMIGTALLVGCVLAELGITSSAAEPLNLYIRAQEATHGPKAHNYPAFLERWKSLLAERGIEVDGSLDFPSSERLAKTDVLLFYCQQSLQNDAQRELLERFVGRGGDVVVLHSAVTSDKPDWLKDIFGGAWVKGESKWSVDPKQGVYFQDDSHPITKGASNFDLPNEEVYWNLNLHPDIHTLAVSYHDLRILAPQMWTYKGEHHRAFVWLAGHRHPSLDLKHTRALVLRGLAWAAGKPVDTYLTDAERGSLRYPKGGPAHPQNARETLKLHPEFQASLVAAEPKVVNPIDLTFDAQGRIWIAETPEYPEVRNAKNPQDRISILEDTNNDGRVDEKKVFYKGLELVTSLALYRDGVLVAQAPEIYWLRDTDGDGKADKKELVLTGFGTSDTHAVVNHLRWGLDGWVYATLGYSRGHLHNAEGKDFGQFSEGVLRFRPNGSAVQQVSSRGGNTWGVGFTWDGELFWSQATSGRHLFHTVMPLWALQRGRIGDDTRSYTIPLDRYIDLHPAMRDERPAYVQVAPTGGFTAGVGCTPYTGGAWPKAHANSIFVSDPTLWLTHRDLYEAEGITYTAEPARPDTEFLAATDLWFCPVGHRVGPDGALYLVDFYNQAVSHNDIRLSGEYHGKNNQAIRPDRARYFGRLWRLQHNEAKALEQPDLAHATAQERVAALSHPNRWQRMTAQRLLVEAHQVSAADALIDRIQNDETEPVTRLHAVWTLEQLGQLDADLLSEAIHDPSPAVRQNAMRIVSDRHFRGRSIPKSIESALLEHIDDENPRSQLEALIGMGALSPSEETVKALMAQYPKLQNDWARSATLTAVTHLPQHALKIALTSENPDAFQELAGELTEHLARGDNAAAHAGELVELLAAQDAKTPSLRQQVLRQLTQALPEEAIPSWSDGLAEALRQLLESDHPSIAAATVPLARKWDREGNLDNALQRRLEQFTTRLTDDSVPASERVALAQGMLAAEPVDPKLIKAVAGMLTEGSPTALKRQIVEAMAQVDHPAVGEAFVDAYPHLSPDLQALTVDQLLQRPEWSGQLLTALQDQRLTLNMLGPGAVQRLRRHPNDEIATEARNVIEGLQGPQEKSLEQTIEALLPKIRQGGDPQKGKALFTQACAVCHRYRDQGSELGPELTGIGASSLRYLLVNTLAPNRSVAPNYIAYNIKTTDSRSLHGLIARESSNQVVLRNQTGTVDIPRSEIESMQSTGRSLMPEGFASLGAESLSDLIAYLRQGETGYRIVDLSEVFTTDTAHGMWRSRSATDQRIHLQKFGVVHVDGVPFRIARPGGTLSGNNAIVLKGGNGYADTLPQKVGVETDIEAQKLHFLGGVAGWGYPYGDESGHDVPVLKVILHYAGGQTETLVMHNGDEFADYVRRIDVSGSKFVPDLAGDSQVRWFTKELKQGGRITRIELASYDNHVAPSILGITAER